MVVCDQIDAALDPHGHQIAIAQRETQIPADAQHLDLPVEFRPLNSSSTGKNRAISSSSQLAAGSHQSL
jgi:hypothetical protein